MNSPTLELMLDNADAHVDIVPFNSMGPFKSNSLSDYRDCSTVYYTCSQF